MQKIDSTSLLQIAIFGFSANPPGNHHLVIVNKLLEIFDKVILIPRGTDSNKPSTAKTTPLQRKEMVRLAFENLPQVEIDFSDLNHDIYTPTWRVDHKYKKLFPDSEIWHAVGGDIIKGGADGNSEIQIKWRKGKEIWNNLNWAMIDHPDFPIDSKDLPPNNMVVKMGRFSGRSTIIRRKVADGQPISDLVPPEVEKYILENNFYK